MYCKNEAYIYLQEIEDYLYLHTLLFNIDSSDVLILISYSYIMFKY
jgi:hypothetical protein